MTLAYPLTLLCRITVPVLVCCVDSKTINWHATVLNLHKIFCDLKIQFQRTSMLGRLMKVANYFLILFLFWTNNLFRSFFLTEEYFIYQGHMAEISKAQLYTYYPNKVKSPSNQPWTISSRRWARERTKDFDFPKSNFTIVVNTNQIK